MNSETIILREISQARDEKHHMASILWTLTQLILHTWAVHCGPQRFYGDEGVGDCRDIGQSAQSQLQMRSKLERCTAYTAW